MRATRRTNSGLGLALLSAAAFGGSGVAAKPLIEAGFDPLHVVWMRVAGAALILLPVALRHRALPRRRPGLVIGFGLLGIAGCQALYFLALARIPVGVAILVEYLGPALLLGWVRFVQRRPVSRAAVVGVVLAVAGMACVVEIWSGLAFAPVGLLCAFGAACCQVAYFVLADHGTHGSGEGEKAPDPVAVIAHGLLIGTLVLTVFARPWNIPWAALTEQAALGDRDVPALVLMGWIVLVSTVVSYLTGIIAVRRLSPQIAAVVSCVEAVVGTVLAWFLLGEHLGGAQIAGGALVLAGAFAAQTAVPGAAKKAAQQGIADLTAPAAAAVGTCAEPLPPPGDLTPTTRTS
jgi:drug/metabolite transporter (DMT)-like permease